MEVFNRVEQKYILTEKQYKELFKKIESHLEKDYYYQSKICNLYFDNDKNNLIVSSLERPIFKEKIRLRSYNVPNLDDIVYLELKGKYDWVVFKRRCEIILDDFYKYIETGIIQEKYNNQIMKENDYVIKKFNLKPKIFIGYDRLSFYDKDDINFRVTFDSNLRSRVDELKLELGDNGNLFDKGLYIMEVKSLSSIPLWFTRILSEMKIYKNNFSKYGEIYIEQCLKDSLFNKKYQKVIKEEEKNLNFNYMEGKLYV